MVHTASVSANDVVFPRPKVRVERARLLAQARGIPTPVVRGIRHQHFQPLPRHPLRPVGHLAQEVTVRHCPFAALRSLVPLGQLDLPVLFPLLHRQLWRPFCECSEPFMAHFFKGHDELVSSAVEIRAGTVRPLYVRIAGAEDHCGTGVDGPVH